MAKKVWQLNETHALIAAVRKNPSLYDRRDPDYSRAKDDIWKRISMELAIKDKNAEQCKIKWKTLRIQLRRIFVDKIKNSGNRSKVRWNCYDQLKFLIPHMDSITTDDTKKDPELSILSDDDDDYGDCDNETNGGGQSDDGSSFQSSSNVELGASAQADSTNTTRTTQNNLYKIENENNPNHLGTYLLQNSPIQLRNEIDPLMTINTSNQTMPFPTNAPNYFLMDIGMQMERLNIIAQMEIKIEIHRLLLEKLRDPSNLR